MGFMRIQTISVRFLKLNKHRMNYICKFVVYKYAFSSIVYNYSPKNLEILNRVEWSEDTIRTHIKLFIKWGWCKMEGKHLRFLSKKELNSTVQIPSYVEKSKDNHCNYYYKIKCSLNYKEVRTHLYAAMLTRKLRQMEYKRKKQSVNPQEVMHNANREGLKISLKRLNTLFGYRSISSSKKRVVESLKCKLFTRMTFRPQKQFSERLGSFVFKNPCTKYWLSKVQLP